MPLIDQYLQTCIECKGSDLHIASESPVYLRQLSRLCPISDPLPAQECEKLIFEILNPFVTDKLKVDWEVDTAYTMENGERFRINAYRQRKGWDAVFRHFSSKVSSIDELGLPPILKKFSDANQGLILITGPGRSGKSTTCAALVDYMNGESEEHIITIEDPIEYIHKRKKSLVNQRSVGPHTASFSAALRSALREDPDIIMVGEMRDYETMSLALTAAEQSQAVASLSESLVGIVSQRLLVNADGTDMVPAFEILVNSLAMANTIRAEEYHKIPSLIATGGLLGMQTMEICLRAMAASKKITPAQAEELIAEEA